MARMSFFGKDTNFVNDTWLQNAPEKDRANLNSLDDWLMAFIGRGYDIPDKPLEENEVAEIPKCEANIFFNALCMSIGWRKKKLLGYLTMLSDFNVILFSIHDKYFTCEHIEMYGRFSETAKRYLRKRGVKAEMIRTYKSNITLTKLKGNNIINADDSPKEEESQQIDDDFSNGKVFGIPTTTLNHLDEVNIRREQLKKERSK